MTEKDKALYRIVSEMFSIIGLATGALSVVHLIEKNPIQKEKTRKITEEISERGDLACQRFYEVMEMKNE